MPTIIPRCRCHAISLRSCERHMEASFLDSRSCHFSPSSFLASTMYRRRTRGGSLRRQPFHVAPEADPPPALFASLSSLVDRHCQTFAHPCHFVAGNIVQSFSMLGVQKPSSLAWLWAEALCVWTENKHWQCRETIGNPSSE